MEKQTHALNGRELALMSETVLVNLKGMEKDLGSIKELMTAVTAVLRDNLITLSGHDNASREMRQYLLTSTQALQVKVEAMEGTVHELAEFRSLLDSNHTDVRELIESLEIKKVLAILFRMEKSLGEFIGLKDTTNPVPLARDIRESLQALRDLTGKDPDSGKPLPGPTLWWRRMAHVFELAVAGAALALLYHAIAPYISFHVHN